MSDHRNEEFIDKLGEDSLQGVSVARTFSNWAAFQPSAQIEQWAA